jgi:TRAP-type C4-dicarboxylate transport system permease small subunit
VSEYCQRVVSRAITIWAAIGGVSLLLLVLLTGVGVFFRYVLNTPINGLRDLSQLLLLFCVSGAIPYAAMRGSHVAVDLLTLTRHPGARRTLSFLIGASSVALLAVMLVALARQGSCGFRCGQFTPDLVIPFWPMYLALGIGFFLYLLQIVFQSSVNEHDS